MSTTAPEVCKAISSFTELRSRACEVGPKRVGVVLADDDVALTAASDALLRGIAFPVLIGEDARIRAPARNRSGCSNSRIAPNSSALLMPRRPLWTWRAKAALTS
jgi:hypothetical protein